MLMSVRGLYNIDKSLFDSMQLPELIDRQLFIDYVCMNFGELEVLYPSPLGMETAIAVWSRSNYESFDKVCKALNESYSAVENYNRIEEYSNESTTNSDGRTTSTEIGRLQETSFESGTMRDTHRNTTDNDSKYGNDIASKSSNVGHIHGNIGVTTNQQMIVEEMKLRQVSMIGYIADSFKNELLLQVY